MTVEVLLRFGQTVLYKPELPRCEHSVSLYHHLLEWRQRAHREGRGRYGEGRVDQCTRDAVVRVDGVPLCRRHAGQVVLDQYIAGDLIDARAK